MVASTVSGPNHASLDQEGHLEVGESSALADASALAVPATLPQTTRSTGGSSLAATFRPTLAAPSLAAAPHGDMLKCSGSSR